MIPPNTPPGTLIVWKPEDVGRCTAPLPLPKKGRAYTLATIHKGEYATNGKPGYGLLVEELDSAKNYVYCIGDWEIAVLPRSLTRLIEKAPVPEKELT